MFLNSAHRQAVEQMRQGKLSESLQMFNSLVKSHPENANLLHDRGVVYIHLRQFEAALRDMDAARDLEPGYSYRYASRAYVKEAMGDTNGAIEDYRLAIALDPEDAISHNNLGLLEEKKGNTKHAKSLFKLADALSADGKTPLPQPENIQRQIDRDRLVQGNSSSVGKVLGSLVSSPASRKEFWEFIRSGFKLRK